VQGPLLLVGCGKMGGALLDGWLARGFGANDIAVVEPGKDQLKDAARRGVIAVAGADNLPTGFAPAVVILAVKPQYMDAVAASYTRYAGRSCFLSIAAGRSIASLQRILGADAAIVRAMPNLPAAVGRGITAACPNAKVTAVMRASCDRLLSAVGEVAWIDDEALIDAVTALSGSGPAYVFLLIEAMAAAGAAIGLPPDLALRLARATVCGAGELAHQSPEPAAQLRRNVTSPAGTTEAALKILMAPDGIEPLLTRAMAAARDRARQLSN
jgi:pyrroline-5-carboxylate reductase